MLPLNGTVALVSWCEAHVPIPWKPLFQHMIFEYKKSAAQSSDPNPHWMIESWQWRFLEKHKFCSPIWSNLRKKQTCFSFSVTIDSELKLNQKERTHYTCFKGRLRYWFENSFTSSSLKHFMVFHQPPCLTWFESMHQVDAVEDCSCYRVPEKKNFLVRF